MGIGKFSLRKNKLNNPEEEKDNIKETEDVKEEKEELNKQTKLEENTEGLLWDEKEDKEEEE